MKFYYSDLKTEKSIYEESDLIVNSLIYPTQIIGYEELIHEIEKTLGSKNEIS